MKTFLSIAITLSALTSQAQKEEYKVANTFHVPSPGGWDYIAVNNGRIYLSHGGQVNILDEQTGDSVGVVLNTSGVHGVAFDNKLGRGYTSNGRSNNVTVFDLKTNQVITQVTTGENPDAIMYEPHTKTIITCNGRSKNLSVIDPGTNKLVTNIALEGKPEEAVSDGKGKLFVNLEDKNEVVEVDLKSHLVIHRWSLNGDEGPTGLKYDAHTKRLFIGCDKHLVVMDATNGTIVAKLPIGEGCDGVAFDPSSKTVFTSNGRSGNMTVIKEKSASEFAVVGNYTTKRGARTIAIDEKTGTIFMPTADFEKGTTNSERPKMIPGSFQVIVVKKD